MFAVPSRPYNSVVHSKETDMNSIFKMVMGLLSLFLCTSCAHLTYDRTGIGKFEGSLDVRWIKPDKFIYVPSPEDPLRFTTSDRRVVAPQKMYTDGGSIPRLFWGVPGYSPWGYAPAYIIHDWLFEAHHCNVPEYRDITFDRSASILAEGIKTLMVTNMAPKDETTLWAIYEAVRSPIAKSVWDKAESCKPPIEIKMFEEPPGELLFKIRTDQAPRR
jgi:hypothetical protein